MTTAVDIIAALLPRKAAPTLEKQTRMPYGWGLWLRGLRETRGAITRERAQALTDHRVAQPLPAFGRERDLGRFGAFRSLFYQGWEPPLREERGLRWLSAFITLLLHLFFMVAILWLAWINIPPLPPAVEESRTRLEYIGEGTPEQTGSGPPTPSAPAPAASSSQPAVASASASQSSASPVPATEAPAPAPAEQPLQVTETEQPPQEFVVPPPTVRENLTPTTTPRTPQQNVVEREVAVVEVPTATPTVRPRELPTPSVRAPDLQIREREVSVPLSRPNVQQIETPIANVPSRSAPSQQVREREIAMPQPGPATTSAPPAPSGASQASKPAPAAGITPSATASGPTTGPKPGALPSPRRADDWGDSTRNTAGQPGATTGDGLFNSDGRPNLPGDTVGNASTQPGVPGSRQAQARDDAAANTFLRRVPFPYEPTMFDKDWHPRESLLQEWVRRNIREVEVSIPGTSKKVRCVISVLQLGGGCGLFDPNLNNQPAIARPPPVIPKKRNPIKTDS